jgi:hypothetical protein
VSANAALVDGTAPLAASRPPFVARDPPLDALLFCNGVTGALSVRPPCRFRLRGRMGDDMGPLLALVAQAFEDITLTPDGLTAMVRLDSNRGPILLALPLEELAALSTRGGQVARAAAVASLEEAS